MLKLLLIPKKYPAAVSWLTLVFLVAVVLPSLLSQYHPQDLGFKQSIIFYVEVFEGFVDISSGLLKSCFSLDRSCFLMSINSV